MKDSEVYGDYSSTMFFMVKGIKDNIGRKKVNLVNLELGELGLKIDEIKEMYRKILKEDKLWRS